MKTSKSSKWFAHASKHGRKQYETQMSLAFKKAFKEKQQYINKLLQLIDSEDEKGELREAMSELGLTTGSVVCERCGVTFIPNSTKRVAPILCDSCKEALHDGSNVVAV